MDFELYFSQNSHEVSSSFIVPYFFAIKSLDFRLSEPLFLAITEPNKSKPNNIVMRISQVSSNERKRRKRIDLCPHIHFSSAKIPIYFVPHGGQGYFCNCSVFFFLIIYVIRDLG